MEFLLSLSAETQWRNLISGKTKNGRIVSPEMLRQLPPTVTADQTPDWLPVGWIAHSTVLKRGRQTKVTNFFTLYCKKLKIDSSRFCFCLLSSSNSHWFLSFFHAKFSLLSLVLIPNAVILSSLWKSTNNFIINLWIIDFKIWEKWSSISEIRHLNLRIHNLFFEEKRPLIEKVHDNFGQTFKVSRINFEKSDFIFNLRDLDL